MALYLHRTDLLGAADWIAINTHVRVSKRGIGPCPAGLGLSPVSKKRVWLPTTATTGSLDGATTRVRMFSLSLSLSPSLSLSLSLSFVENRVSSIFFSLAA